MLLRILLLLCFLGGTAIAQIEDSVLLQILRNYEATLQSKVHPDGLQTMVIEGEGQKVGGEKQRFKTIRKYPNKIRNKTIDGNGVELIAGSNGKDRWGRAENEQRVHFYEQKVNGPIDWLPILANFENHLLRALKGDKKVQLTRLPNDTPLNSDLLLHVIEARDGSDLTFTYYLSSHSDCIVRTRIEPKDAPAMEVHYSNYRSVDDFELAHRVKLYEAGELISDETYLSIQINKFIYDFLFEKPGF